MEPGRFGKPEIPERRLFCGALCRRRVQTGSSCQSKATFPGNFNSSLSCCLLADESEVEQITATPCGPQPFPCSSSASSLSVTSQPTPRTDPLLHRTSQDPPAAAANSDPPSGPPPPPPDADKPKPSPSGGGSEEEEGGGGGARCAKDTKHRTLLEIDRFTLCGNRID